MTQYPDPVIAAGICELAGADGITFHLREDRRHIQDRDVRLIKEISNLRLNFEMAASDEMLNIAKNIKPFQISLVPEKRQELTTEGGLDVIKQISFLKSFAQIIKENDIRLCIFVDPDLKQIDACKEINADYIEIHTGTYCDAKSPKDIQNELNKIITASKHAKELGLGVNAGHGIYYHNVKPLANIKEIEEFSIGHGIISRAVIVGLETAVREMKSLIQYISL